LDRLAQAASLELVAQLELPAASAVGQASDRA
jgi:hypothetical protein